jgi:hypothetical protein
MNFFSYLFVLDWHVVAIVFLIVIMAFFVFCARSKFHQKFPKFCSLFVGLIIIPGGALLVYKYVEANNILQGNSKRNMDVVEFAELNRATGLYFSSGDIIVGSDGKMRIKKNAVESENIKNKTIKNNDIATDAIDSRAIKNGSIAGNDISTLANLTVNSLDVKTLILSDGLDMSGKTIRNIGSSGTDFTSSGGLNLAGDFKVDDDAFFVDAGTGYVGIGTTDPQQRLDIHDGQIMIGDGDDKTQKLIEVNTGHNVANPTLEYTDGVFGIDGLDGLTLSNGLEDDEAENALIRVKADDADSYLISQTTNTDKSASVMAVYDEENDSHWGEYANKFIMQMSPGAAKEGKLQYQYGFDAPVDAIVVAPPTGTENGIEKVYFPNGNIGIGTDNPMEKLSVNGDIGIGSGQHETIDLIKVYAGHSSREMIMSYVPRLFGINKYDGLTLLNAERGSGGEDGYFRVKSIGANASLISHTNDTDKTAKLIAMYDYNGDGTTIADTNQFIMEMNSGAGKEGKLQYQFGVGPAIDALVVSPTNGTTNDVSKIYFPNGNVGIGTDTPDSKLEVSGGDIRVTGGSFIDDGTGLDVPDYVFKDEYKFLNLDELKKYINKEDHLPGVPDMDNYKGWAKLSLQDRDMTILEKTEENTLYILQNYDAIEKLKNENEDLKNKIEELEKRLDKLENETK